MISRYLLALMSNFTEPLVKVWLVGVMNSFITPYPPLSQGMPLSMSTQWVLLLTGCMLTDQEVTSIHGNYMPIFHFFSFLVPCSFIISMHVSHATSFPPLPNPPFSFALLSHYLPLLSGPPCQSLSNLPLTLRVATIPTTGSSQPEFSPPNTLSTVDGVSRVFVVFVSSCCVLVSWGRVTNH